MQRRIVGLALGCTVIVSACSITALDGYSGGAPEPAPSDNVGPTKDAAVTDDGSFNPPNGYRAAILAAHPIAYWRFEERVGTTFTDEIQGRPAVATGVCSPGVASAPNLGKSALGFDGASCRLDAGDGFAFIGRARFTIEVWIRQSGPDEYQHLFTRQARDGNDPIDGYALLLGPGGKAYVERATSHAIRATPPERVPSSVFSHVVGTYDGDRLHLYIDGIEGGTEDDPRSLAGPTVRSIIGENSTSKGWFSGTMDELAIYDDALSAETVSAHFALGVGPAR